MENLESRLLMAAQPVISEFLAKNTQTLLDGNGNYSDWVELQNTGDAAADLTGWHLSDDPTAPDKWTFPATTLAAGGFLVVFADGTGTVDSAGNLHTNFSLDTDGETLQLNRPDLSVASQFAANGAAYPKQQADVSYGTGTIYRSTTLVGPAAPAKAFVPKNGTLDASAWTAINYDDSTWTAGTTGVGYDTGAYEDDSPLPTLKGDWVADDLTATVANGGRVARWSDEVNRASAVAAGNPLLVANDFGAHAGVKFNPADGADLLRVPAAANPMSGADAFTVAVAFKATSGIGSNNGWYNNAGLVDAQQGGTTNDWGLSVAASGSVAAGIGSPDATVYSAATTATNGAAHVAVYTRSGTSFTVYLDGGAGVTGTCSATARNTADMVFGAIQTGGNSLAGDVAEVRVYAGAPATAAKAYALTQPMAAKYGVTLAAPPAVTAPTLTGDWTGDGLTATVANGGAVTAWTSTANGTTSTAAAAAAATAPNLATGQLNGHAVVRFTGANADQLRVPAATNPMAGATNFTVAVVFRTSTAGVNDADQWYDNTGLVDAEVTGTANDWGLSLDADGEVGAGLGNPDASAYTTGANANGTAHVVVLSKSGTVASLYLDGLNDPFTADVGAAARDVADMVFGSIQTGTNFFTGDLAEVQVYNGALTADAADQLAGTLGTKYGVVPYPSPYKPQIGLNLQSAMSGQATTAAVRVPFTVAGNPSVYSRLQLKIEYDDGFVAYLNGTEVARRNAPAGAITYASTAGGTRSKHQALTAETIDLSAYLPLLAGNGQRNVLAVRALNSSLADPDLLLLPTLVAATSTVGPAYFATPTPGAANTTDGYAGIAAPVTVSVPHGIYTQPFATTIASPTPGATIYYTTDGSDPGPDNGTAIAPASATAAPSAAVTVSASTPLRAAAFADAYVPSAATTVTYVFPASVLAQGDTAPPGAYWPTVVDPRVVNNTTQAYSVTQALSAVPTMSLVLPDDDMFGAVNGIYTHPNSKGSDWERAASAEYFDPANPTAAGFTVNAGLRIQGGADRSTADPKKSFRLFFRSQYGASKLDYPLFGAADPQQSFDHLILKAIHNFSWANIGGAQAASAEFNRDRFARDLQMAMTGHASQGKWVQLYINGQYWGLYDATEEPDSTWAAANFGGDNDDYDVIQPSGNNVEVVDGSGAAYTNLFTVIAADMADNTVSAAEYAAYKSLVDVKGLADYMLNVIYRGDNDAPVIVGGSVAGGAPRNFYAFRNAKLNGPYEFTTWDGEYSLTDPGYNRVNVQGQSNPALLFQSLKTNPDFAQLVADEAYKFYYNGGVLESDATVDNPRAHYDALAANISVAVVGESARWGYFHKSPPFTRDDNWLPTVNRLDTSYFPQRSKTVLGQLKAVPQFAMLGTLPPTYKVNGAASRGGQVAVNSALTLVDQNATTTGDVIYYTLDGSDPRLSGGGVSAAAKVYSGAITLSASRTVTVRILNGATWSPIDQLTFGVNAAASAANLAVTEVNYHPADPTAAELAKNGSWTDNDFEFIELQNTTASAVDLTGAAFDLGVTLTLGAYTVAAGGRVVVVSNPTAFAYRYGTTATVVGTFAGHLSNSSATIDLKTAAGAVIANFTYQDSWYPRTDGDGSSLEVVTTAGSAAANWRASYEVGGTPGTAGNPVTDVVVNEVLSAETVGGQDQIELYNTTNATINIGGWFIGDTSAALTAYTIPAGTTIAAHGFAVFTAAQFDNLASATAFGLNGTTGDEVFLTKPKTAGGTTAYAFADTVTFGTAALNESFGRSPDGVGILYPQQTATLGAANSGYRIGPVTITELMYNPTGANANLQYVEVQNQTAATVDVSGWQFSQGVTYTFPAGTTLAPYEAVTIVHFALTDTASLAAFRSAYGTDAATRLLGPFTGTLASKGEQVQLSRPDAPRADAPAYTPLLLIDDVTYAITAPWPTTAVGQSLVRTTNRAIGEYATSWTAAAGSPDAVSYGNAYYGGDTAVTLPSGTTLDSLTLGGTAVATVAAGTGSWVRLGGLVIAAGAKLDVGTGALILDGVPLSTAAAYATAGYANGRWTGTGLTSSAAAANAAHTTAVGVASNAGGVYATFDGQPVSASSVLVRYTYYGDANLDGKVNAADYTRADVGAVTHATGWLNGDFNYDGVVDGTDYALMDNAFNQQGSALFPAAVVAAAVAKPASAVAPTVPWWTLTTTSTDRKKDHRGRTA